MPSKAYRTLTRSVASLRSSFLSFAKRTDGSYTQQELMNCRACITFCHAEVEIYLEDICGTIISKAERRWQRHRRAGNAIGAMISYRLSKDISLPENPKEQGAATKFETLVEKAIANQRSVIRNNNGIKAKNIAHLFLPIGLKPEQLEESLLIQLDNLGERRGDLVHLSSKVSLPKIRDSFDDEKKDIDFLISELEAFDTAVNQLT